MMLQKLRCKCNFHALKFVPKIQETSSRLVRKIRKNEYARNMIDKELMESFIKDRVSKEQFKSYGPTKYVALHLRFKEDMVVYSLCDFGGGEAERRELQAYREAHFPIMLDRLNNSNARVTPSELRLSGWCPLTPEESGLVLASLGFKRETYIYQAGSQIYGGKARLDLLISLYPNLGTKEDILSGIELEPFKNFSSQLVALDYMVCATADVFVMTDFGSQFSSLVSRYRTYFGLGKAPIIHPNKKTLATIFQGNSTIVWREFRNSINKMVELERIEDANRGYGQSIYRHPTRPSPNDLEALGQKN